jgi:hypothetical protein
MFISFKPGPGIPDFHSYQRQHFLGARRASINRRDLPSPPAKLMHAFRGVVYFQDKRGLIATLIMWHAWLEVHVVDVTASNHVGNSDGASRRTVIAIKYCLRFLAPWTLDYALLRDFGLDAVWNNDVAKLDAGRGIGICNSEAWRIGCSLACLQGMRHG